MPTQLFLSILTTFCGSSVATTSAQETPATAGERTPVPVARFAPPVLLLAGDEPMGKRRLYPSPVLQDMNGDGRADVVLGDLWGRITVAPRLAGEGAPRFGKDEPLLTRDGEPIDFANW